MSFIKNITILFTATINVNNSAHLDGQTVPSNDFAGFTSAVPLHIALWHQQLAHHHHNGVKKLLDYHLVTGMDITLKTAPDPVCEPCLTGKMHANLFKLTKFQAKKPLELVH